MLEGLADYLGDGYEFVLHSLENLDQSAVKVINGHHTGRKEGAPITDLAIEMLSRIQNNDAGYCSYHVSNSRGEPLKGTTITIRGENGRIIGLVCINFYLNTPLAGFLKALFQPDETKVTETFAENMDELLETMTERTRGEVDKDESIRASLKKFEIVSRLHKQGVFRIKDAVPRVAGVLGISRNTVYLHLRSLKDEAAT
jgi:predicted transcriptional regulator YheO